MTNKELTTNMAILMDLVEVFANKIDELEARIAPLETPKSAPAARASALDESTAWQLKYGSFRKGSMTAKAAATVLGLTTGQVYSIWGGYTFNQVKAMDYDETDFTDGQYIGE